jgi:Type IV secretion-system coupling protein DNA-binding domain
MDANFAAAILSLVKFVVMSIFYGAASVFIVPMDIAKYIRGHRFCWPRFLCWAAVLCSLDMLLSAWFAPLGENTPRHHLQHGMGVILSGKPLFLAGLFLQASRAGERNSSSFFAWQPPNPFQQGALASWKTTSTKARDEKHVRGSQVLYASNRKPKLNTHLSIGTAQIDPASECQHFLISGRTGSGKSQAIYGLLTTIAARRQPAFIADPGGGYLARFGDSSSLVLNPFDQRDAGWSPFREIQADYDCERIAKAAIPDADGDARQWHFYAQSLLAECLRVLWNRGNFSIKELLRMVTSADRAELAAALAGTAAQPITQPGAERMLGSTRSIIATHMAGWRYLPDQGSFSIREWVRQCVSGQGRWLFSVYRDDQMALLRLLISCWIDIAVIEILSQPEDPARRLWLVLDEMDSLGKVGAMRDGLTKLRKYGGAVISGLQTIAQLRTTYGRDEAQVLLSCLSTKLVLAAGDAETAKYFEEQIGQQEVKRHNHSRGWSSSLLQSSKSRNISEQNHVQATVLASEITSLPDLNGYVQTCSGTLLRVAVPYRNLPRNTPEFVPRSVI